MLHYTKYKEHEYDVINKKVDSTIYTFDIETTSYYILDNKVISGINYDKLSDEEKDRAIYQANMYIWQFGINVQVYYGRTWSEFIEFLNRLEEISSKRKIVFVHNLSFEFQFLRSIFKIKEVTARKSRHVMTALLEDYNILFKCSYMMSNCKLERLATTFNLPVKKLVGALDYTKLRHSETALTKKELEYCEYDCLVVYYYILFELKTYKDVSKIPTTSTGHVRRELKDLTRTDYRYKSKVRKSINVDGHVYNLLTEAFMGGYTHANYMWADEVIKNVDSYDETSCYPYTMVVYKFPATEFIKVNIKDVKVMSKKLAYLLVVKFKNVRCKYYNNFISASKCRHLKGAKYDNGRIIEASEFEITLTDIDFYFILDTYTCEYEIIESYYSVYKFLPIQFINFVLDKYVKKTEFKGIAEKETEYQLEKMKFNALYGMSVTSTIADEVIYDNKTGWSERELTNEEITDKLLEAKKIAFLSFSYGVWVTAIGRDLLLRRVIALDEYVIYCDTDSIKLASGYDKNVFINYNESVKRRIEGVSEYFNIDINRFAPCDIKGVHHMLGVFESETKSGEFTYDKFITQGAKKYAVEKDDEIAITVAGVPKKGAKALKKLEDFKDDLVFKFEDTGKNLVMYNDSQVRCNMIDYKGVTSEVKDKTGVIILPNTYKMSKAYEYNMLLTDLHSKRAKFKE